MADEPTGNIDLRIPPLDNTFDKCAHVFIPNKKITNNKGEELGWKYTCRICGMHGVIYDNSPKT
jgi:hypothetical protein